MKTDLEKLGRIKEIDEQTKLTIVESKSGQITRKSLRNAVVYSRPDKKSDIVRITPNDVVKAELTSDVIKEPEFDHYILIKKPNTSKLLLLKSDYHVLHPVRKAVVDEGDRTELKSYREMRNIVQETFGSAKQQRLLKKDNEKGVFSHGDEIDPKLKTIPIPAVRKRKRV